MRSRRRQLNPQESWAPFAPDSASPWDLSAVAHLHRRAGFQASWAVLERDREQGPEAAIRNLIEGDATSLDGQSAADFEQDQDDMARQAASGGAVEILQAAWLYRLIHTPHPMRERMSLFWHNHFATSQAKVANLSLMSRQNGLFRTHALGDFRDLLKGVGRDPAMLIWLDATTNRKAHPNENYAREVMELFALGRGHYTEKEIREAARALTGTFVQGEAYQFILAQHDAGTKTLFGRSGLLRDQDVAEVLVEQPACSRFLARKLAAHFINETQAWTDDLIEPLAERLRSSGYQIVAAVEMILRSRLFFDPSTRRARVKSPVELVVGSLRALEAVRPTVSTRALARACDRIGQSLFLPPNVAGWPGGMAWINTSSSLARANFAAALLSNDADMGQRVDPLALAARHGKTASSDVQAFYRELLLQDAAESASDISGTLSEADARSCVVGLLASPEFQLA